MKTESRGGSTAESTITRNLARLFGEELDRAERYFPTMRTPLRDAVEGRRPRGHNRLRLAAQGIAFATVAIAVASSAWLAFGISSAPTGAGAPGIPTMSPNALGADGLPNQIDGEHVYRVGETVESDKQGGYLLGGYVFQAICPVASQPLDTCFGLGPTAGSNAATGGIDVGEAHDVSDPNPFSLGSWVGAPIVASMKGCTWDNGTPCPPVVMAIVWPAAQTATAAPSVSAVPSVGAGPALSAAPSSAASAVALPSGRPEPSASVAVSPANSGSSILPPSPAASTLLSATPNAS
jgi:hypothetical protein